MCNITYLLRRQAQLLTLAPTAVRVNETSVQSLTRFGKNFYINTRDLRSGVGGAVKHFREPANLFFLYHSILSQNSKGKTAVIKTSLATLFRATYRPHSSSLGHLQAPSFFTCDTSLNFYGGERWYVQITNPAHEETKDEYYSKPRSLHIKLALSSSHIFYTNIDVQSLFHFFYVDDLYLYVMFIFLFSLWCLCGGMPCQGNFLLPRDSS